MIWNKLKYLNFEDIKTIKSNHRRDIIIKDEIINIKELEKLDLETRNSTLKDYNTTLFQTQEELREELESIKEEIINRNKSEIDNYLSSKYKLIKDKIYTDKREIKGIKIPIRINDMIQPEVYAIEQYLEKFKFSNNLLNNIKIVANDIASWQWTSDRYNYGKDDQYATVSEILALKKDDCESMCHVLASCFSKQVAIVYGFSTYGNFEPYGHAWCEFVYNNELYVADCWLGDNALVDKWENVKHLYEPYFIYTKRATYEIKKGEFGFY